MAEEIQDFEREINEAWQILDEEKRAIREAYAEESEAVEREAAEEERRLINRLQNMLGSVEDEVEREEQNIERDIESLETAIPDSVSVGELEQKWEATMEAIAEFHERSAQSEISDREAEDFRDDVGDNLQAIEQRLRPLIEDDMARQALEDLRGTVYSSVETHHELFELRQILMKARQSVELQERLAENEQFDALNEEIMNIGTAEENLEEEAQKIEQAERQLLDLLEEAGEFIQDVMGVDQDVIDMMEEEVGDVGRAKSALDSVLGSDLSDQVSSRFMSADNLIMMLREIDQQNPEHDFMGLADFVQNELKPTIEAVQSEEQRRLTEEYRITEELEEYVQEHRDLLQQESTMEPEDPLIPEEDIENALQGAPSGTSEFIEILEELIAEKDRQELVSELQDIRRRYEEVYRVNELEEHDIEEFDKRVRKVEEAVERVKSDWEALKQSTRSENLAEAQGQPDSPKRQFSWFMNGKRDYFGLRNLPPMIQTVEQDLEKLFEEDDEERNAFQQVHQEIQDVKQKASGFLETMERLEELEREFSTGDAQSRNMQNRRRVYFQVFKTASKAITNGDQSRLREEVREVRQYIDQIESEIQRCTQIMREEVKEEDLEREELEQAAQDLRTAVRELEDEFKGGERDGPQIPGTVEKQLDQIDEHLEGIVEKIEGRLIPAEEEEEQAEQSDEQSFERLKEGFEETDDALDPFDDDSMEG
ncbi:MAG: hypothetical protein ABEI58_04015 [Candidatus Nanohaloarchaea archaeon]